MARLKQLYNEREEKTASEVAKWVNTVNRLSEEMLSVEKEKMRLEREVGKLHGYEGDLLRHKKNIGDVLNILSGDKKVSSATRDQISRVLLGV